MKYTIYKQDFTKLPSLGPDEVGGADDLDEAKTMTEEMVRDTGVIVKLLKDVELTWKCVNDGTKPGHIQVYNLWGPNVWTGYSIQGPHVESGKDGQNPS